MLPLKAKLLATLLVCCMLKPFAQTSCVPVYANQYVSSGHMEPYTIKALADGSFLIAGRGTANGQGPYDGMVMRVTGTGTIIWSFLIGGTASDEFTGIAVLADSSFILSGSTASYGHPESKGWLVHIDKNGNLVWSKQIGSTHTGTDRIKAVTQYSDKDIIGTFNEDDSTALSNPVVFKIGEDGTMRWCTKFDNGKDDGFVSIAYSGDTVYAAGYYSAGTAKKAVITQLNASNGTLINARNMYNPVPYDQEIVGLEIFNHTISYGLWLHGPFNVSFPFNGTVYVETNLAGKKQMALYCDNGGDIARMIPFRTTDSGFYLLRPHSAVSSMYYPASVCKMNRLGKMDWGNFLDSNSAVANMAMAVTADSGLVAATFYNNNTSHYLNQMRMLRMNKTGDMGNCQLLPAAMYTDTLGYSETPFSWSSVTAENPDQSVIVSAETVNSPTMQNLCMNPCIDKTPLPPGCNQNYRIEYGGAQLLSFNDAITTPDGGRIVIGDNGYNVTDGLVMKTDVNGQPLWSKRFEHFRNTMKFMRIIRTSDNNYWIFANEYNSNQSSYIDLIKIDASGNIISSVQFDAGSSSVSPFSEMEDVVSTPDGGFILVVNNNLGISNTRTFIIRYDANGSVTWQKEITHPGFHPIYKSISCSSDAVFVAYDGYDVPSWLYFGVERVDLKTGNLMWYKRYSIGNQKTGRVNRIFSINDTTYTFVNNFTPVGFDSITHTILAKVDPEGNLIGSLLLKGETMTPGGWYPGLFPSPPTITMTTDNDFVLCGKASVNGISKMNIVRFDKTGKASWSRNYESAHNLGPENIHQQGTGFLIMGETDTMNAAQSSFSKGFLLKVDGNGQIMSNGTGDCQPVNRNFSASPGSIHDTTVEHRQTNDIKGTSWKPFDIVSQDWEINPTAYCTQKGSGGGAVSLKQSGYGCSLNDTLVFYLQDAVTMGASATWQYDNQYFRYVFSNGDSILLQPVRSGQSVVKATVEGYCFLDNQQISASVSRAASSVNLGPDTVLCKGKTIKLSAGSGFSGYLWNDLSTDSTLTVNSPGKYYVQVSDLCDGKSCWWK